MSRYRTLVVAALALSFGCRAKHDRPEATMDASAPAPVPSAPASAPSTTASAPPAPGADAEPVEAAGPPGCPKDMVRVEGDYCPGVMQDCLEHHPEYLARKGDKTVSERCLRYDEPSRCVSPSKKKLGFCMDKFEWPNKVGEMPRVLTSWLEAKVLCERAGKRLCTEDEHNFACEGPEMLPYATGYERDTQKCNMDKPYVQPDQTKRMLTYDDCWKNERCAAEMKRLDQRHAIGAKTTCVSWAGVVDINGNVNEWVEIPGEEPPNRSGLKGGWWGPVRSRCRPTVTFHKEHDYGYEAGFRCCRDLEGASDGGVTK